MRVKTLTRFKEQLARVFDDNLRTRQWENYLDYTIIGFIVLSTTQVFLSTYDNIVERYGRLLDVVDVITTIFFTIEVTLRIWTADILNPKYKGFLGRIRYCLNFYALIDILSTYPFYLHFFMPIPYAMLKTLRIARLLRIFRYVKAFSVLRRAISSKQDEMKVSLQFLVIVTLILSFILFFVEHEAQPEVYNNGWTSFVWAFAQYIEDPGEFAVTPPITFIGRMVAVVIGILGIAIFAVPAGLIGSAFSDVMAEDENKEREKKICNQLYNAFERKMDRHTSFQVVPRYATINEIQARLLMTAEEVITATRVSDDFRLINLGTTQPMGSKAVDLLAVELCCRNTSYGCLIDRNSPITIASPSNIEDPIMGNFAFYLALIGGFNFISREVGQRVPYKSYYLIDDESEVPGLYEYMEDLRRLTERTDSWCWTMLATSGSQTPEYPNQFHFCYGGAKGNESYEGDNLLIQDMATFKRIYEDLSESLETIYGFSSCRQRYHGTSSPRVFARHLAKHVNTCIMRIAWSVTAWDSRYIEIAKLFSDILNKHIGDREESRTYDPILKKKSIGFDGYL